MSDTFDGFHYEPDETPKRKHGWPKPHAGFSSSRGELVGKCPSNLTLEEAQSLLDDGVPYYPPRWRHDHPQRIYAVLNGVVYRAMPTNPGRSYHGFPEHPTLFPCNPAGKLVRKELMMRAALLGSEKDVKKWMNW